MLSNICCFSLECASDLAVDPIHSFQRTISPGPHPLHASLHSTRCRISTSGLEDWNSGANPARIFPRFAVSMSVVFGVAGSSQLPRPSAGIPPCPSVMHTLANSPFILCQRLMGAAAQTFWLDCQALARHLPKRLCLLFEVVPIKSTPSSGVVILIDAVTEPTSYM